MNDEDRKLLISRLATTSEWSALNEFLNERRVSLINQVIGGHLDQADYHRTCGEIKGLDAILTAPATPDPKRPASRSTTIDRR